MSSSLTVALISTERRWQGGEEQARQLALGLRRRGHRCVVFGRRSGPFVQRMQAAGFDVISLAGRHPSPWRCWTMRRDLHRLRVDVVHFNDAHAVTLGGLAAWRLEDMIRVAARRACFPIRSPGKYRHLCDRIFCVSTHAAELCADAGIPRDQLRVVHDGVDPARVGSGNRARGRGALDLRGNELLLLSVGSLASCKGHRFLLEAMPQVLQQYPQVQLAVAGEGDQREALRQQAQQLGIAHRVRWLGFRSDIPDLIHACDLFVFPSVEEGLGSTLIDVMLAERPIVTTNAGGIPDVVESGAGHDPPLAWIVPPRRSGALAKAMTAALRAPDRNGAMIQRAGARARNGFTVDHMVRQTLLGYLEALAEKGVRNLCLPKATQSTPITRKRA